MSEKKEDIAKKENTEIAIIDEQSIRDKIYIVRGVQVMLDFDLAEIYGYETKNFNRQVKNNAVRFEGDDFMFQLTDEEVAELSRCKNFTLNRGTGRGSIPQSAGRKIILYCNIFPIHIKCCKYGQ